MNKLLFFICGKGVDKRAEMWYNGIDSVDGPGDREICENYHKQKFFPQVCEKNNLLNFPKSVDKVVGMWYYNSVKREGLHPLDPQLSNKESLENYKKPIDKYRKSVII